MLKYMELGLNLLEITLKFRFSKTVLSFAVLTNALISSTSQLMSFHIRIGAFFCTPPTNIQNDTGPSAKQKEI